MAALGMTETRSAPDRRDMMSDQGLSSRTASRDNPTIMLFLCGDVMTGRGIDQVLPHPSQPAYS